MVKRLIDTSPPRRPPRPRASTGVIQAGSTTQAVLAFLATHPKRRFSCWQICAQVERSPRTISWSIVYLRTLGYIDSTSDERNVRYLRYRITEKGRAACR